MEAGTVRCPSCGAAISQDCTQCPYCSTLLQTVACPSCFAMMFRGSKYCPHCGAAAEKPEVAPATARHCPRCRSHLAPCTIGEVSLEQCGHCGGLWIAAAAFDRICADREAQSSALGLTVPPPQPPERHVYYLKCPQCTELMTRRNYAHRSGVIIDICRPHGIWLDRDELRRIVEFIRAGGLDRARELDKMELDAERGRLERERWTIGSTAPSGDSDSTDSSSLVFHALGSLLGSLF